MPLRRTVVASLLSRLHRPKTHAIVFGAVMTELLCLANPAAAQTTAPAAQSQAQAKDQKNNDAKPASPVKQEEQAAKPAAEGSAGTVTVVGNRESNRIDRQVYDVSTDVAASASTAADALNKVPSVSVTSDGTVTLRGNTNVQIHIDGKPSAMMQGESRGAVLNSMPAEDIQSVEVINNPGAQFGNEGGGGPILNLVLRRQRPGAFGGVTGNAGPDGRRNANLYGNVTTGSLGVQGSAFVRRDHNESTGSAVRDRYDTAGALLMHDTQSFISRNRTKTAGLNTSLTYHLSEKDVLGAGLSYSRSDNESDGQTDYLSVGQNGTVLSQYLRSFTSRNRFENFSGNVRYEHKGALRGELFKMDLRLSGNNMPRQADYAYAYAVKPPRAPHPLSRQDNLNETRIADFTGDYERPLGSGTFKAGYKLANTSSVLDVRYADLDTATLLETINASRTNRFEMDERTAALWGSYEWKINDKWGVMGGLRAEYTDLVMDQVTSRINARNNYISYIPSFFARYYVTDNTTIRFSYAHRIRRPGASELNPFVIYVDELNVSSGNPALKPSESDSFELGYETKMGQLNTNLRAYFRRDSDVILPRQYFIGDNVLLTTRANAGTNRSGGLEFTLGGKLLPKLSVNTSGNLAYVEQNAMVGSLGGDSKRTTSSLSGRAMFNYELPNRDQLQLMLHAQGKTLTGQGERSGWQMANLDYRRNITPALSLVVKVDDLFESRKMESFTDTALLKETSVNRFGGRVFYVGFSYRIGGFAGAPAQRGPMMMQPGGPRPGNP